MQEVAEAAGEQVPPYTHELNPVIGPGPGFDPDYALTTSGLRWPAMRLSASSSATASSARIQLARLSDVEPIIHMCVWL